MSDGDTRPSPGGDLPAATPRRRPRPRLRRLVTDQSFLRRLHSPPLLGFLDLEGFHPAARALSLAADFTFSFLPSHCRWSVQDVRDGRVLLHGLLAHSGKLPIFRELVVCDPLHRKYVLLPPLPDDLAASVEDPLPMFCAPNLISPSEEAEETASSYLVSLLQSQVIHLRLLFEHRTMECRCIPGLQGFASSQERVDRDDTAVRYRAPSCLWLRLLGIDDEAGEGRLGMFRMFEGKAEDDLRYIVGGNRGLSSSQWEVEKTISLDPEYRYCMLAAAGRYLLLDKRETRSYECYLKDGPDMEYFSLDVQTWRLQRVWGKPMWSGTSMPRLYTNFPPSLLSSPTV